jgi:UDP-N-acetylmuramate dehydrogenase
MTKDREFRDTMREMITGTIQFDEPMSRHTSMGVGGAADVLVWPGDIDELRKIVAFLVSRKTPFLPVGNCTNLIIRDSGYRGVIISLRRLEKIDIQEGDEGCVHIYAQAGVRLSRLVELSVRNAFTGLEFCAGIPGSVGGGMKMNAGAYGTEFKDVVGEASFINGRGVLKNAARDELQFEYRNLTLPADSVIISAVFGVRKGSQADIRQHVAKIMDARKKKHPLTLRNAGSIFKNPVGMPAGKIIDEAGLRGCRIGDAEVSEVHGNFIVNLGNARAKDVLDLMALVQKKVLESTGLFLEPEVKIIGEL